MTLSHLQEIVGTVRFADSKGEQFYLGITPNDLITHWVVQYKCHHHGFVIDILCSVCHVMSS